MVSMTIKSPSIERVTLGGQRFVILPESEYDRLLTELGEPPLPAAGRDGNYPASATNRVLIARDILRNRRRLGLTQVELARRAGVRPETLNRIERGDRSPSLATLDKIDRALTKAEAREDRTR